MKTVLWILYTLLISATVEAVDTWSAYFRDSSSLWVTITMAVESEGGVFVPFATQQLSYNGRSGHVYTKFIRPDLVPSEEWDIIGKNLFFDEGTVREEDSQGRTWSMYKCSGEHFREYIYYIYSGASLITGVAQEGLSGDRHYTVVATKDAIIIKPKSDNPVSKGIKSICVQKAKPMLLQELIYVAIPSKAGLHDVLGQDKYSYDSQDLVDWSAVQLPVDAPEVKNPLEARMKYP